MRFGTDPSRPLLWIRRTGVFEPLTGFEIDRDVLRGCVRGLKDRAGLDVGESSRPQEGILSFATDEGDFSKQLSAAVTTCPGLAGEEAHVRFLPAGNVASWALDSGVRDERRGEISALVSHGRGVFLVAGPVGSGKRRMLRFMQYFLKEKGILLHSAEERMVERNLGVMQAQVDLHRGQDYAHLLETFMAHGTDAILIDRLEDAATARAVFALPPSGPLVVCAITAANATNAIERLEGFGLDRQRIADGVLAVLGQRLLRRVCPSCSTRYRPRRAVLEEWFPEPPTGIEWQRGAGCLGCAGSGFDGRILATELWMNGPGMRRAILESKHGSVLRDQMLRFSPGFGEDALGHVLDGSTTLEEALKVIPYEDVATTRLNDARGGM
jgi:type II secretory ATPase GspE/PulE/Tfp pilus assembly ATPase PilB-like protein